MLLFNNNPSWTVGLDLEGRDASQKVLTMMGCARRDHWMD